MTGEIRGNGRPDAARSVHVAVNTPVHAGGVVPVVEPDCIATSLRMLSRAITSIYDDALRPLGLRITQMSILTAIRCGQCVTASELAKTLIIDRSTLSRTIDRMIEHGWLAVGDHPDARVQPLTLTDEGCALLAEAEPARLEAQRRVAELLGPGAVRAIHGARGRITRHHPAD